MISRAEPFFETYLTLADLKKNDVFSGGLLSGRRKDISVRSFSFEPTYAICKTSTYFLIE